MFNGIIWFILIFKKYNLKYFQVSIPPPELKAPKKSANIKCIYFFGTNNLWVLYYFVLFNRNQLSYLDGIFQNENKYCIEINYN